MSNHIITGVGRLQTLLNDASCIQVVVGIAGVDDKTMGIYYFFGHVKQILEDAAVKTLKSWDHSCLRNQGRLKMI